MSDHHAILETDAKPGTTVMLGFGPQEMDWLGRASSLCGRRAVMDQDVARMAGATFAVGTREALDRLRQRLEAGAMAQAKASHPGLSHEAMQWLAIGERGMSSEAMFEHLTGVKCTKDGSWPTARTAHPYDVDDFRRCRLLLEQVPELQDLLQNMATLSPEWANLTREWGAICAAMDREAPNWREPRCPGVSRAAYTIIKAAVRSEAQ